MPATLRLAGILLLALTWIPAGNGASTNEPIRIASKTFTESHVLGEIFAQLLESHGVTVERQLGLGGTLIAYEALKTGASDLYPEYTGTIKQAILQRADFNKNQVSAALNAQNLQLIAELGFNNSYAIAVSEQLASELGLTRISDLQAHPGLRLGFSHEFLNREDGWLQLRARYQLPQDAVGIEHALAYDAIENRQLDATDAYTTDGELTVRKLVLLEDNLAFFPRYDTVILARQDLPAEVVSVLQTLQTRIDEDTMRTLNARVTEHKESPAQAAAFFLRTSGLVEQAAAAGESRAERITRNTLAHLKLTGIALAAACILAIPLAVLSSPFERLARSILYVTGLIQTIPALALLALMIPVFGLGEVPAIIALFLYSLMPIVRNTLTGLFSIDPLVKEVATGMGMKRREQLWHIELPLAFPAILAGVKTAAIISLGTATLAAFVGAGGLGEPIITGLNLNNHELILEGAIPAAVLAVAVELLFELIERGLVPAHLRDKR